jgi:hypothetical protein
LRGRVSVWDKPSFPLSPARQRLLFIRDKTGHQVRIYEAFPSPVYRVIISSSAYYSSVSFNHLSTRFIRASGNPAKINPYQQQSFKSNIESFIDAPITTIAQPRLLYYISRNTGAIIPLITADELPLTVQLQGLPRVLRPEDTAGMRCVRYLSFTGATFTLEQDVSIPQSKPHGLSGHDRSQSGTSTPMRTRYLAPDAMARQALGITNGVTASTSQRPPQVYETAIYWRSTDKTT